MFVNNMKFNDLIDEALKECDENTFIPSFRLAKLLQKQHKHIMRDIREELDRAEMENFTMGLFTLTTGLNDNNNVVPYYKITYDGVLYLAGRYSRYNYTYRKTMTDTHIRLNLLYKR